MAREKEQILFEWECPKEIKIAQAKTSFRRWLYFSPRFLLYFGIIWIILYFAFDYMLPRDSGIHIAKLFIRGFVSICVLLVIGTFGEPLSHYFSKPKYQVTSNGIRTLINRGSSNLIKWKEITGYMKSSVESLEKFTILQLFYKKGRLRRTFYLPNDDRNNDIINIFAQRVPLIEQLPLAFESVTLTAAQKLCIITVMLCYSCIFAWCIVFKAHWLAQIAPFTCIIGPGFICMPIMFGKRFFQIRILTALALFINFFTLFLMAMITSFLIIYEAKHGGSF
jgi:hypothetical protein